MSFIDKKHRNSWRLHQQIKYNFALNYTYGSKYTLQLNHCTAVDK